jgi:predicted DNA-binding transcriptional regulator AlpA
MVLEVFSGMVRSMGTGKFVTFGTEGRCYVSAALARNLDSSCCQVLIGYDAEVETLYLWSVPAGDRREGARLTAKWRDGGVTIRAYPALRHWSLVDRAAGRRAAVFAHGRIEIDLREPSQPLTEQSPADRETAPPGHAAHKEETAAPAQDVAHPPEPRTDAAPAVAPAADLIDVAEVCRVAQIAVRSVGYFRKLGKFPAPVSKRGPANLWRREDIAAWVVARTGPPVEAGVELLDMRAVAALLGCAQMTLYNRISRKLFPPHTKTRGNKHFWTKTAVEEWLAGHRSRSKRATPPAADQAKTCATCADNTQLGKHCFCRSQVEENPNRNTMIEPTHGCEFHRKPGTYRPVRMDEGD